jgi:spore germination cell wall hydrolase CwlJ-like protein
MHRAFAVLAALWLLGALVLVVARCSAPADAAELPAVPAIKLQRGELQLMAATVWAEARSDGAAGMLAVANVIINRTKQPDKFAASVGKVVRQPYQFSVWLPGDANRSRLATVDESDPHYLLSLWACLAALTGSQPDITGGAVHFVHVKMKPRPRWTMGLRQTAKVGSHVFFAGN